MPETTFTDPDLTTFLGLDALGLIVVGQHLTAERAVIECRMPIGFEVLYARPAGPTSWWCACGASAAPAAVSLFNGLCKPLRKD